MGTSETLTHTYASTQTQTLTHTPSVRRPGTIHTIRIRALDAPTKLSVLGSLSFMDRAVLLLVAVLGIIAVVVFDKVFKDALPVK